MCDGKNHPLVLILVSEDEYDGDAVAKWCPDCGAVVVDRVIDGRVSPGGIKKMRFPKSARR